MFERSNSRPYDSLRPVTFERDFTTQALGSVLIGMGKTRVLCTASVEEDSPRWLRGTGKGWVTAEYSLLPGSSKERVAREAAKGKQSGRTQEIQRLIARSLRAVCDLSLLNEKQIIVDCDVIEADGGTRTASICGGFIALRDAISRMIESKQLHKDPILDTLAAVSVGIVDSEALLDLEYEEDSNAHVDMNVVMTGSSKFVELQGTAEGAVFSDLELENLLKLAKKGIREITLLQNNLLATPAKRRS